MGDDKKMNSSPNSNSKRIEADKDDDVVRCGGGGLCGHPPPAKKAKSTTGINDDASPTAAGVGGNNPIGTIIATTSSAKGATNDNHQEKASITGINDDDDASTTAGGAAGGGTHEEDSQALLSTNTDIWVEGILPFLGPGNYIFVASTCRRLKEFYETYFSTIDRKKIPLVFDLEFPTPRKASVTYTFHSAAFSSLSCAKFWDQQTAQHRNRLPDNLVCQTVAKEGNLDVLQWARANGCEWGEWTCARAAEFGHLHGCPWDSRTLKFAIQNGHQDIVEWARANGCPEPRVYRLVDAIGMMSSNSTEGNSLIL